MGMVRCGMRHHEQQHSHPAHMAAQANQPREAIPPRHHTHTRPYGLISKGREPDLVRPYLARRQPDRVLSLSNTPRYQLIGGEPWPYLSPFLRYGQFFVEKRTFFLLRSHSTPNLKMFLLRCITQILYAESLNTLLIIRAKSFPLSLNV